MVGRSSCVVGVGKIDESFSCVKTTLFNIIPLYASMQMLSRCSLRSRGRSSNENVVDRICFGCFFEAQVCDQLFYQEIVRKLNGKIDLSRVTMNSLDCMVFGYFLSFILRNTSELCIDLSHCSIDDHSLCVLMESSPSMLRHPENLVSYME